MPAINLYPQVKAHSLKLNGPYSHAAAVTPHDTNELTYVSSALWVGGTGILRVVTMNDEDVTIAAVPAGAEIRIRVKKVMSTTTTATSIVALW